jgi:hypothetical protein
VYGSGPSKDTDQQPTKAGRFLSRQIGGEVESVPSQPLALSLRPAAGFFRPLRSPGRSRNLKVPVPPMRLDHDHNADYDNCRDDDLDPEWCVGRKRHRLDHADASLPEELGAAQGAHQLFSSAPSSILRARASQPSARRRYSAFIPGWSDASFLASSASRLHLAARATGATSSHISPENLSSILVARSI